MGMVQLFFNGFKNLVNNTLNYVGTLPINVPRPIPSHVPNLFVDVSAYYNGSVCIFRISININGEINIYPYNGVEIQGNVVETFQYY